jgi:hypothetical protein
MLSEHKLEVLRAVEASESERSWINSRFPAQPTIGGDTPFDRGVWQDFETGPLDPDASGIRSCPRNGIGSWRRPCCFQSGPHGRSAAR